MGLFGGVISLEVMVFDVWVVEIIVWCIIVVIGVEVDSWISNNV